jgi:hypothetical protein
VEGEAVRVDDLIGGLKRHKERYGNTIVRFYVEKDGLGKDWRIGTVYPVNIHTSASPVWCCMLSD